MNSTLSAAINLNWLELSRVCFPPSFHFYHPLCSSPDQDTLFRFMSRRSLDDLASSGQSTSRGKTVMPLPPMSPPRLSPPSDSSRTRRSEFVDHARAGPSQEPDTRSTNNSSSSRRAAVKDDFESRGDAAADEQMDGMDEEGPIAFQCAKCRTILGDSLSWVTLRKDLKMVVIASE